MQKVLVDIETGEPYTLKPEPLKAEHDSDEYEEIDANHEIDEIQDIDKDMNLYFDNKGTTLAGTLVEHQKHSYSFFSKHCSPIPIAQPVDFPSAKGLTLRQFYEVYIHRTPLQCHEEFQSPQRSEEWKLARKFSLTASDFGAAAGKNQYDSPEQLVQKKIHTPFQGNSATQWGCEMETRAAEAFLNFAKISLSSKAKLYDVNLVKFSSSSWLAVSPDNILCWTDAQGTEHWDLVEYKCPTRSSDRHPYAKYENNIPPYYKCQMLGIWGHCNDNQGIFIQKDGEIIQKYLENVWFVVWSPNHLWVTHYSPNIKEWRDLHFSLRAWYFEKFLPALYSHCLTL